MERSKRSQSAAVRWALEQAIDGATPEVTGASNPGVPKCIDLPRGLVKMPDESASRAKLTVPRSASGGRGPLGTSRAGAACTEMHQNAPKCTVHPSRVQNEPNSARRDDSPAPVDELTPRQLQAIALLFAGWSYTDVGRQLKINRSTLFRWRQSPTFIDEVRRRYAMSARRTVTVSGRHA
jgi:hypothetical protein